MVFSVGLLKQFLEDMEAYSNVNLVVSLLMGTCQCTRAKLEMLPNMVLKRGPVKEFPILVTASKFSSYIMPHSL